MLRLERVVIHVVHTRLSINTIRMARYCVGGLRMKLLQSNGRVDGRVSPRERLTLGTSKRRTDEH